MEFTQQQQQTLDLISKRIEKGIVIFELNKHNTGKYEVVISLNNENIGEGSQFGDIIARESSLNKALEKICKAFNI